MEYKEYFRRKVRAGISISLGILILLIGLGVITLNVIMGYITLIFGFVLISYGVYKLNELRFEREETGVRLYHQKGNY